MRLLEQRMHASQRARNRGREGESQRERESQREHYRERQRQPERVTEREPQRATESQIQKRLPQVSVFGGYTDERGDAARNSMSLLEALHDQERTLEVRGRFGFGFLNALFSWWSFVWVRITR